MRVLDHMQRVATWLIEPSAALQAPERRWRARALSGLLLCLVPLLAFGLLFAPADLRVEFTVLLVVLSAGYLLSRTRHYTLTATLTVLAFSIAPLASLPVVGNNIDEPHTSLSLFVWLAMGVGMSSVVFSVRTTVLIACANAAELLVLALLGIPFTGIVLPLLFLLGAAALIIIAAAVHEQARTRAEMQSRELKESEARFRSLFEAAREGIVIHDHGAIIDVNPAFEAMFGYGVAAASTMTLAELFAAESPVELPLVNGDGPREMIGRKQDGSHFCVEIVGKRTHLYKGRRVSVAVFSDITEYKRDHLALIEAKEAAEEATRTKGEFLANMSHEIRTPMNAVIGMTGLLLESSLDAYQRDYVETIRDSGDSLLTIINDILDFSKIEAGELQLEQAPFRLRDCVESALDLVATTASAKRLDLGYAIAPETPEMVIGDDTRIRQILVNLLSNAIKFTEQGHVVVTLSSTPGALASATLGAPTSACALYVAVEDTGIGIPKAAQERLFQPFSQVDASATRKHGGTGLGLAISKSLVELMKGHIWVESEPGKGSTFQFNVQLRLQPVTGPEWAPQPDLMGKSLLVIDDSRAIQAIVADQAQIWGMHAHAASSGDEVREYIHRGQYFDIVLVDRYVVDIDPKLLSDATRRRQRGSRVLPVVMMGYWGVDRERTGQLAFAARTITKPIKPARLHSVVTHILSNHAARSSNGTRPDTSREQEHLLRGLPQLRILVAEDNPVNQKLMRFLLGRLGYRPELVANGREAIEAVQRQRYDVVLMDLQMPEMDGLEAARRIRQQLASDECPLIVAVTADVMHETRERCIAAGMDAYLTKPIQAESIAAILRSCPLRSERDADKCLSRDGGHQQNNAPMANLSVREESLE